MIIGIFPASGALGTSTYTHILKLVPNDQVILINRYPEKVPQSYLATGVRVRQASYESTPTELKSALSGIDMLLLISYPSHVHAYRSQVLSPRGRRRQKSGHLPHLLQLPWLRGRLPVHVPRRGDASAPRHRATPRQAGCRGPFVHLQLHPRGPLLRVNTHLQCIFRPAPPRQRRDLYPARRIRPRRGVGQAPRAGRGNGAVDCAVRAGQERVCLCEPHGASQGAQGVVACRDGRGFGRDRGQGGQTQTGDGGRICQLTAGAEIFRFGGASEDVGDRLGCDSGWRDGDCHAGVGEDLWDGSWNFLMLP
ncbi:hypothetical protein VTI74DRAFT_4104 [Chaetomium olivicolor]